MQSHQSRDEKTLAIASALGVFVLLMTVGSALLWAITSALDVNGQNANAFLFLVVAPCALVTVVYLGRTGKR